VQPSPQAIHGTFSSPQTEILSQLSTNSLFPANTVLLLVSVSLTVGTLDEWNPMIFVLLCQACFTQHCVLQVVACVRISFTSKTEWYPIVWIYHILFVLWTLGLLSPSGNGEYYHYQPGYPGISSSLCFQFFWVYTPRSGIAGPYGKPIFNFWRSAILFNTSITFLHMKNIPWLWSNCLSAGKHLSNLDFFFPIITHATVIIFKVCPDLGKYTRISVGRFLEIR